MGGKQNHAPEQRRRSIDPCRKRTQKKVGSMTPKRKAAPSGNGNPNVCAVAHKGRNKTQFRKPSSGVKDTSHQSYAAIEQLRQTELREARKFFYEHPAGQYSRADLCDHLNKPINHVTRIVWNLLDRGFIEVVRSGKNPRSNRSVEYLRLTQKGGDDE